jgi:hypothetical protein
VESGAPQERLRELGRVFGLPGRFGAAVRHGSGHIHETFVARYDGADGSRRYVHQRLNTRIFRDPERLMSNIERVTCHLRGRLAERGVADPERRVLRLLPAHDGRLFHVDPEGHYWRTTPYLEGTCSVDAVESPAQAREAARAFGEFAALLDDLGPPPLADTIPHFHDLERRFAALEAVLRNDPCGRAAQVAAHAEALRGQHAALTGHLAEVGALPRRVVHNDCKINNLLLDATSGEGLCVVDLDTVMQGNLLCDFGELVRTGTCRAPEDERDLGRIDFDLELFGSLVHGYLAGIGEAVDAAERRALPLAGPLLTLENAVRFLTDHVQGDTYFRIQRSGHNLDRARAQRTLAAHMLERLDAARRAVDSAV